MAKKFLCLETGDRLVKVAVCTGTEKKRKVIKAFTFETPTGAVQDGEIVEKEEFSYALKENMDKNGLNDVKDIIFTISSGSILTQRVALPDLPTKKMESVIETNKKSYFDDSVGEIEDYTIKFRVLARVKKGANKGCSVLVIAIPNSILTSCAGVLSGLKLRLRGVDAVCSSMIDTINTLKEGKPTAFVHLDCTGTEIIFAKGTEILMNRTLHFSGDDFISGFMESCDGDVTYMKSLELLTDGGAKSSLRGKMTGAQISLMLDDLIRDVVGTLSFYQDSDEIKERGEELELEQIVLLGPCANLFGVDELLENESGISVVKFAELSVATTLRSIADEPVYYTCVLYAGAYGLEFAKEFDVRNQKGKRAQGGNQIDLPTAILLFTIVMIFAVYWGYSSLSTLSTKETQLTRLEKEVEDMQYLYDVDKIHTSYQTTKENLLTFTKNTANPNENLVTFLAELEAKMPSEILVLSANCTATSVTLNIMVSSITEAATVVTKLRTFESLSLIQVSGVGLTTIPGIGSTAERREVAFSVVCTYGTNPYTSGWNPYADTLGILNVPVIPDEVA